ncbi:hypothetical protein Tco_0054163 [Tanacetum coccineum]
MILKSISKLFYFYAKTNSMLLDNVILLCILLALRFYVALLSYSNSGTALGLLTATATDNEFEPFEDPLETKDPQPLSPRLAPPSPDYTPATPHTDEELDPFETSETRITSPHSTTPPSDPTSPPSS